MQTDTTTEPRGKKKKANGQAELEAATNGHAGNGVANGHAEPPAEGMDPFAKPGENGIATQPEEPEGYEAPEPTQEELKLADEVFANLNARAQEMEDREVIEALIALVDVHKNFLTPPDLFSSSDDDDEKFEVASVVGEIARLLIRGCSKLEVHYSDLVFYFKDHEKWTSAGQKVHGKVKRFDGFLQHHLEGQRAAIIVNYHLWKTLNPRQKVFRCYNLLRELDSKGKRRAPDWTGYFEEPGLFGAGVHEEWVRMAQAFVREAPQASRVHQMSLLAGIYDED